MLAVRRASSTLLEPFNTTKVGMAETWKRCATSGTASTSTLRNCKKGQRAVSVWQSRWTEHCKAEEAYLDTSAVLRREALEDGSNGLCAETSRVSQSRETGGSTASSERSKRFRTLQGPHQLWRQHRISTAARQGSQRHIHGVEVDDGDASLVLRERVEVRQRRDDRDRH